ncbi:MAG: hypothetical protein JWM19_6146 [Actinomycetia bacterium]|nr:hypothetical protein [Actinomycetes bacterium]
MTLEPHHAALPVSRRRPDDESIPWRDFAAIVARKHGISVAAFTLIAAQLIWKAAVLSHFYFWQDDFTYFARAMFNGFTWHYLTKVQAGHVDIGPFALGWVIARVSEYNWTLVSFVLLAIQLAGCLALLRLLRTLFGNRPAILIPLTFFLLCPLTIPDLVWWSNGIEGVGLQLAIFMALDAHVRYLSSRHRRQLIAAAVWMLVAMLFSDKGLILPFLLFAITSAYFVEGRWLRAMFRALATHWRAWRLYLIVFAGYGAFFAVELTQPGALPTKVTAPHGVGTFMTELIKDSFVPGAFGGPWRWFGNGIDAFATPPAALMWLSWIAAIAVIAATIWYRRYAWRAWAILAVWILVADMAPIITGRTTLQNPGFTVFLGLDTHYLVDAVSILAICLGLAMWPVVGQVDQGARRSARAIPTQASPVMVGFILAAFAIGSVYSVQTYVESTTSQPGRSFIATAREALEEVPPGTVVVNGLAPPSVMASLLLGSGGYEDQVIGAMAPGKIHWIGQPDGTIANLKVFTPDGRLWPAAIVGVYSRLLPKGDTCWPASQQYIYVPLNSVAKVTNGPWTLRMSYVSSIAQQVSVFFGGHWMQLVLKYGENTAYLPVYGSGNQVTVMTQAPGNLCVGNIAVGGIFQNKSDTPVPAAPAPG